MRTLFGLTAIAAVACLELPRIWKALYPPEPPPVSTEATFWVLDEDDAVVEYTLFGDGTYQKQSGWWVQQEAREALGFDPLEAKRTPSGTYFWKGGRFSDGPMGEGWAPMNLDVQYPSAEPDFVTDDGFRKNVLVYECAGCQRPTSWVHVPQSVPLCSRVCYERYLNNRLTESMAR